MHSNCNRSVACTDGTASSVFAITKEMLSYSRYTYCAVCSVPLRVGTLPVLGVVVLVLGRLSLQHLDVHATYGLAVQRVHGALGTVTVCVLRKAIVLSYTTTHRPHHHHLVQVYRSNTTFDFSKGGHYNISFISHQILLDLLSKNSQHI